MRRTLALFLSRQRYRLLAIPIVVVLALTSILAFATTVSVTPANGHPKAVGPISSEDGFPVWYKDSNGVRLELCADEDPLCAAEIPDPDQPVSFPDNFPGEAFYSRAVARVNTGVTNRATLVLALEGGFVNEDPIDGDQMAFGRVRVTIDTQVTGTYTVTHPYGREVFKDVPVDQRAVFFTEDISPIAGDFTGTLNSRIGPFLKWDTGAPAGHVGDPAIDHAITGSIYTDPQGRAQNYFRVEGPIGSFTGSANLCVDATLGASPTATNDCVETPLFAVTGRLATNAGVNADRATYTRGSSGNTTVDVYASSESDQSIQIVRDAGNLFPTTLTKAVDGNYFGRLSFSGPPPANLKVRNAGDNPISEKTINVIDSVNIDQALYDANAQTLTIHATSSDTSSSAPTLSANGFGTLSGSTTFSGVAIPPNMVTVISTKGGFDTAQVQITGNASDAVAVAAAAGANQIAQQGQSITLDGSASTGDIASFSWSQIAGAPVTLSGATSAIATFTTPNTASALTFRLTVTRIGAPGPGSVATADVTVNVQVVLPPVANAGPDQTVTKGGVVTLDGSASVGASGYSWLQTGGSAVSLSSSTAAKPTFTFPTTINGPLTFRLIVSGPGGTSAPDTVVINAVGDTLAFTRVQFTANQARFRIEGTSTVLGAPAGPGNTVSIYLGTIPVGGTPNPALRIGTAAVDSLGAWVLDLKKTPTALQPRAGSPATANVTVISSRGGQNTAAVQFK